MAKPTQKALEIGRRISEARQEAGGMTQVELAELLGVAPRTMQAYEQGEIIPYRHMKRLEEVTAKPVAWFLHGDEAVTAPDEALAAVMRELSDLKSMVAELLARSA